MAVWAGDGLEDYKANYETSIEAIVLEHGMKIGSLGDYYAEALLALRNRIQAEGNLDRTLTVIHEIDRFAEERTVPHVPPEDELSGVVALQQSYWSQVGRLELAKSGKIISLAEQYDGGLDRLEAALTRAGKIEEAQAVRDERARVRDSEIVAMARNTIAENEPDPPDDEKPKPDDRRRRPDDTVRFQMHHYKFVPGQFTWHQAKAHCEKMFGGQAHLACVDNRGENDFVRKLVGDKPVWLGATDEKEERVWVWVNGRRARYTNWLPGLPNRSDPREDYLMLTPDGQWDDVPGDMWAPRGYVAEWEM